jgi:hypothetical protein
MIVDSIIAATANVERKFLVPNLSSTEIALGRYIHGKFPAIAATVSRFLATEQSPLSKDLPLMNPFHVLCIVFMYLGIVFSGKWVMQAIVQQKVG